MLHWPAREGGRNATGGAPSTGAPPVTVLAGGRYSPKARKMVSATLKGSEETTEAA